ncbi:hypothetical protein [Paenibacillus sp. GYB003]|uniref:hypothetical protein n=1 Tax=Paenibacillus sp. GYB003 TaxID=2994392 RepID=UPI002F96A3AA
MDDLPENREESTIWNIRAKSARGAEPDSAVPVSKSGCLLRRKFGPDVESFTRERPTFMDMAGLNDMGMIWI